MNPLIELRNAMDKRIEEDRMRKTLKTYDLRDCGRRDMLNNIVFDLGIKRTTLKEKLAQLMDRPLMMRSQWHCCEVAGLTSQIGILSDILGQEEKDANNN